MMPPDLMPYSTVMTAFLESRLSAEEFALIYLRLLKQDHGFRPRDIAGPLQEVFSAADLYYGNVRPVEPYEVGEPELREVVRSALTRLEQAIGSVE